MGLRSVPLISVIIPVYNIEKYIKECINSVIVQTYSNLEIILVDDGSTDMSGKICDHFKEQDRRIRVIHKKNGGLSNARNAGIEKCKGDFITFVDSDDRIDPTFIATLYRMISNGDYQVAHIGVKYISENGVVFKNQNVNNDKTREVTQKEFIKGLLLRQITPAVWSYMYRRSFFRHVKFKVGKSNEDFLMWLDGIDNVTNIIICEKGLYEYRQRRGSITSLSNISKFSKDCVDNSQLWLDKMDKEYPSLLSAAYYSLFLDILSLIKASGKYLNVKDEIKCVKKNIFIILKNRYLSFEKKTVFCAIIIFPKTIIKILHLIFLRWCSRTGKI